MSLFDSLYCFLFFIRLSLTLSVCIVFDDWNRSVCALTASHWCATLPALCSLWQPCPVGFTHTTTHPSQRNNSSSSKCQWVCIHGYWSRQVMSSVWDADAVFVVMLYLIICSWWACVCLFVVLVYLIVRGFVLFCRNPITQIRSFLFKEIRFSQIINTNSTHCGSRACGLLTGNQVPVDRLGTSLSHCILWIKQCIADTKRLDWTLWRNREKHG